VAEAIQNAKEALSKKTEWNAARVLKRLVEILDTDQAELYEVKNGKALKSMEEWRTVFRRTLKGIKKGELQFWGDPVRMLEWCGSVTVVCSIVRDAKNRAYTALSVVVFSQIHARFFNNFNVIGWTNPDKPRQKAAPVAPYGTGITMQ